MTDLISVHVIISGRVQGVWYRAWCKKEADKLSLNGWVRNKQDKTVEAVFSGPKQNVEKMIAACKKGPPLANVSDIKITENYNALPEPGFHTLSDD
ncbi:MAG: acylphosphatase [Rhodospirillaceae bacterium]|nr:acylphosphatase [Rhodospirillaceae bacterium]